MISRSELRHRVQGKVAHRGDSVVCTCCGRRFDSFRADKAPNRVCWWCGAYERERAIALLWRQRPEMVRPRMRILHVAPEPPLVDIIRRTTHVEHVGGDIDQRFGSLKIDVTELAFPQESFDAVICNHVLEHVPDDRRAMAELLRVLRPGGWGLLMAPLRDEPTDEDPGVSDPQERIRRFGQHDHVRWYNRDDYVGRLRATGWNIEVRFFGDVAGDDIGRFGLRLGDDGIVLGAKRLPAAEPSE